MQGTQYTNQTNLSEGQSNFNDLLTNTINKGKEILNRSQIVQTYVEAYDNGQRTTQNLGGSINISLQQTQGNGSLGGTQRDADFGDEREDDWTKTNRDIDSLYSKQKELVNLRKTANGPDLDHVEPEYTNATINRMKMQETQAIAAALNNRELGYAIETPLRSNIRYDRDKLHITPGETTLNINDDTLINRYHTMKQQEPAIKINTLKFAGNRINPPRCLLDVLDSLFSLVFGIFNRIDDNYFSLVSFLIKVIFIEKQEILLI